MIILNQLCLILYITFYQLTYLAKILTSVLSIIIIYLSAELLILEKSNVIIER